MASQRQRLEKTLRSCAEAGIPDTVNLWPAVRERAMDGRAGVGSGYPPPRMVSRRRVGWLIAALIAVLLTGTGAYAATSGVFDRIFATMLPQVPAAELEKVEAAAGTDKGFTLTVDRAFVDQYHVIAGYTLTGPDGRRWDTDKIAAVMRMERVGGEWLPESGLVGNLSEWVPKGKEVGAFAFQPMRPFEAGETVRLRATLNVDKLTGCYEDQGTRVCGAGPQARPSVVFEARVRETQVLEVDQTVASGGVPMTLTRVVNSPVMTSANLCFEPPGTNDQPVISWRRPDGSSTKPDSWAMLPGGDSLFASHVYGKDLYGQGTVNSAGCSTIMWSDPLADQPGAHSLTVSRLESSMFNLADPNDADPPMQGSWRFEFEIPAR